MSTDPRKCSCGEDHSDIYQAHDRHLEQMKRPCLADCPMNRGNRTA